MLQNLQCAKSKIKFRFRSQKHQVILPNPAARCRRIGMQTDNTRWQPNGGTIIVDTGAARRQSTKRR